MARQKSNRIRFTLLGLIVALLYSVLAVPAGDSFAEDTQERNLAINQSDVNHASHQAPISLPGEEKEEESRTEEHSKIILDLPELINATFLNSRFETISFSFARTSTTLAAYIPLYLLKRTFLI